MYRKTEIFGTLPMKIADFWGQLEESLHQDDNSNHHVCVSFLYIIKIFKIKLKNFEIMRIDPRILLKELNITTILGKECSCSKCKWIVEVYLLQFFNQIIIFGMDSEMLRA
jgi:hypothetical protein